MSSSGKTGAAGLLDTVLHSTTRYLGQLPERPVGAETGVAQIRERLPGRLQDDPLDPTEIVRRLAELGETATVATAGPRYFGFVTGGSVPAALGAELLAAVWDQNAL